MKRYEQAKRLLASLDGYRRPDDFSDEMISAVTADFDRLFELTWKFIKEYLQHTMMIREAATGSPKEILKIAYREYLIMDENIWTEMLKDRNDDTHHYSHSAAVLYVSRINDRYLDTVSKCIEDFAELIPLEDLPEDRLSDTFFEKWKASGLKMDDFVEKIRQEKGYATKREVIDNWDE